MLVLQLWERVFLHDYFRKKFFFPKLFFRLTASPLLREFDRLCHSWAAGSGGHTAGLAGGRPAPCGKDRRCARVTASTAHWDTSRAAFELAGPCPSSWARSRTLSLPFDPSFDHLGDRTAELQVGPAQSCRQPHHGAWDMTHPCDRAGPCWTPNLLSWSPHLMLESSGRTVRKASVRTDGVLVLDGPAQCLWTQCRRRPGLWGRASVACCGSWEWFQTTVSTAGGFC